MLCDMYFSTVLTGIIPYVRAYIYSSHFYYPQEIMDCSRVHHIPEKPHPLHQHIIEYRFDIHLCPLKSCNDEFPLFTYTLTLTFRLHESTNWHVLGGGKKREKPVETSRNFYLTPGDYNHDKTWFSFMSIHPFHIIFTAVTEEFMVLKLNWN